MKGNLTQVILQKVSFCSDVTNLPTPSQTLRRQRGKKERLETKIGARLVRVQLSCLRARYFHSSGSLYLGLGL